MLLVFWDCCPRKVEAGCMLWKFYLGNKGHHKSKRRWLDLEKETWLIEWWGGRKERQLRVDGRLGLEALCPGFVSLMMPTGEDAAIKTCKNKPVSASTDLGRKRRTCWLHIMERPTVSLQICLNSRLHMTRPVRKLIAFFLGYDFLCLASFQWATEASSWNVNGRKAFLSQYFNQ